MTSQQKTTLAVLGIAGFSLLGCCGLTLAAGAFAAWEEQRALGSAGTLGGPVALSRGLQDAGEPPLADEREAFARALVDELADAGHAGFEWSPDDDSLTTDGGTLALGNLYAEWLALDPEARPDFVRGTARGAFPPEVPDTWEAARPHVLVTVRDRLFVELLALRGGPESLVLHRPLADGLEEVLVYDSPHSMQYLKPEHAARWGLDAERLFKAGRSELLARSRGATFELASPGLYESPWRDNHDVGRAVLPALLRGLALQGDPVLFLPHRDHLLVAGSDDPGALAAASERVRELLAGPRGMSGRAWRLGKQGLQPFTPPGDAAHAVALRGLLRTSDLRDANEQKDALDAKHEAEGVDLFVGTALVLDDDAGAEVSYAVWTRGVDSLLPRTDFIVFVDIEQENDGRIVAAARWEDVERQARGELRRDDSTWPPRYRARHFPGPAIIKALGLDPRFAPDGE